jgi:hypothetical protein
MWQGRAQCRCRCGRGEPSPGADVAGASPVPAQMWDGRAQCRCRCGRDRGCAHWPCSAVCDQKGRAGTDLRRDQAVALELLVRLGEELRDDGQKDVDEDEVDDHDLAENESQRDGWVRCDPPRRRVGSRECRSGRAGGRGRLQGVPAWLAIREGQPQRAGAAPVSTRSAPFVLEPLACP